MRILRSRFTLAVLGFTAAILVTAGIDDSMQSMLRGNDLISSVYQKILGEYVEEVSPDDLLHGGVDGMLQLLDPYAELIEERENSEVDMLSHGSYSGLGIKVRKRDGKHIVTFIYDEIRPLTTLRIGDQLLRIDTVDLRTNDVTDLRTYLRGQAGTTIRLLVSRPGLTDSLPITVTRRKVEMDPLPFSGMMGDGVFYMKLTRFSRPAVDSFQRALRNIYAEGGIRGIIIDLRDNPGGLLESAVALVDQFVAPGTAIVAMRGRQPESVREYFAKTVPIDADSPIAVLVNGRSASASEIVAGALQDLDRAVIIGERTFGKGLVQTLLPLNYNAFLKLTTSRYYIPSGRCIQRLSYENGKARRFQEDLKNAPEFHTLRLSRVVRESNGIVPDVVIKKDSLSPLMECLASHEAYFTFVARHINEAKLSKVPKIGSGIRKSFKKFADSLASCVGVGFSDALKTLRSEAARQGLSDGGLRRISQLEKEIEKLYSAQFNHDWELIQEQLKDEFTFQLLGEALALRSDIAKDKTILQTIQLLEKEGAWESALTNGLSY